MTTEQAPDDRSRPREQSRPDEHRTVHIPGVELPPEDLVVDEFRSPPTVLRIVFLIGGLGLFVTALGLMKAGAQSLVPTLEGSIFTDNAWSTLGLGWLGACIVLSGSPVAASALSLLDGGAIDRVESFTMLTGSRLGAAFVVLVAGAVYAIRKSDATSRRAPISIGILSLLMTMVTYVPGSIAGFLALQAGWFDGLDVGTSPALTSATDAAFGWAVAILRSFLPGWALFPVGVVVLLAGFNLFDRVLPAVSEHSLEERGMWQEKKWAMFLAGAAVCSLTLSVSVALTVLVPLVAKGYLRRANTLPYIAGANITTLADTLVAAVLLGNQDAVRVVVAVGASVTVWTLFVLAVPYPVVRAGCLEIARRALLSPRRLLVFVSVLLAVPVGLIVV